MIIDMHGYGDTVIHYSIPAAEFVLKRRLYMGDAVPTDQDTVEALYNEWARAYDVSITHPGAALRHLRFFEFLLTIPLPVLKEAAIMDGVIL